MINECHRNQLNHSLYSVVDVMTIKSTNATCGTTKLSTLVPNFPIFHIGIADYLQINFEKGHFMCLSTSFDPSGSIYNNIDPYT